MLEHSQYRGSRNRQILGAHWPTSQPHLLCELQDTERLCFKDKVGQHPRTNTRGPHTYLHTHKIDKEEAEEGHLQRRDTLPQLGTGNPYKTPARQQECHLLTAWMLLISG